MLRDAGRGVVEHRADVHELGVEVEALALALRGAERVHAQRVVIEEVRLDAADQLGRLTRQPAVGDGDVVTAGIVEALGRSAARATGMCDRFATESRSVETTRVLRAAVRPGNVIRMQGSTPKEEAC